MKKLFFFLITISIIVSAQAKWASIADAPTKSSRTAEITVNKNGTLEYISEELTTILNEAGRSHTTNTIHYNGDSEKVEILEAETIYKNKKTPVNKNLLEDKPLASSHLGFDQSKQILVAFPNIGIGATTHLKTKTTVTKPPLENFYGETFFFGNNQFLEKTKITIKSQLPLYTLINDPEKYLKITEKKGKNVHTIEIKLAKPIYKSITNETGERVLNLKHIPYVSVSSLKDWKELAKQHGEQVEPILSQKLPKTFEKILKQAKNKKTETEQINTVTSLLNDHIRYMGDWRTVKGRFVPRNLNEISKTKMGDCKDFSAATIAILNQLGFVAEPTVVNRSVGNFSPNILPSFSAFNHFMVKATNKSSKVYWIDPTNFASMVDGIFPDIADKKILISNPKHPAYEKTPPVNYNHAKTISKNKLKVLPTNIIVDKGILTFKNEAALILTGAELQISKETIKDMVFRMLAGRTLDKNTPKNMELPPLKSRIVKDITIKYSFEREDDIVTTNIGPALKSSYMETISNIYNISQDDVSDALISGLPYSAESQIIIKNIKAKNIASLNKEIKTPWIYLKRSCSKNKNGDLQIDYKSTLYKNIIPSEDFKKPEFIMLKKWLKKNFKDVIIVFEPK